MTYIDIANSLACSNTSVNAMHGNTTHGNLTCVEDESIVMTVAYDNGTLYPFANWLPGKPDDDDGTCIGIYKSGYWWDGPCSRLDLPYICEVWYCDITSFQLFKSSAWFAWHEYYISVQREKIHHRSKLLLDNFSNLILYEFRTENLPNASW